MEASKLANVHGTAAEAATKANGGPGQIRCARCGAARRLRKGQVGRYIFNGWPLCCGATMTWERPSP